MIGNDQTCSSAGYSWTTWFDRDDPSGNEDNEAKADYIKEGYNICNFPIALEVSVKKYTLGVLFYVFFYGKNSFVVLF